MLKNKKGDMTPFDMGKPPKKQNPLLLPIIWAGSFVMTRQFGLKIHKKNMKGLKPPFLVFSTHQGFSDYYIAPLALFPHRANYVSDMEGFAAFGEWLYRSIGCIGKRRYVPDIRVVQNIGRALDKGQSVVIFPESRHSNVGTTAYLPDNLGRLAKLFQVPVVTLSVHGSYLANPFWDEEHTRKVPMEATLECICTKEELTQISEETLQQRIAERLQYDEYAWQQEKKIKITSRWGVEGMEKVLYQCNLCGLGYGMYSMGSKLICDICNSEWMLMDDGQLMFMNETKKIPDEAYDKGVNPIKKTEKRFARGDLFSIPEWYEWQRDAVKKELQRREEEKRIRLSEDVCEGAAMPEAYEEDIRKYNVCVEALPNAKGFVPLGEGQLILNEKGFRLILKDEEMFFAHATRESVQTECNYRGRGSCIVLSDKNCCYYIYSEDKKFSPTELQFFGEALYRKR